MAEDDEALLKRAEAALTEIKVAQGLSDEHASVLAALRIRLEGAPRKSLEDLISAAGDIEGKRARELEERLRAEEEAKGDLGEFLAQEPKKKGSLDDLL